MTIRKLEKSEWRSFFDGLSRLRSGNLGEIEVVSPRLGDQVEAEWVPVQGLSYDPKDDVLAMDLENLEHLIWKPLEIYVDMEGLRLSSMAVVDAEGAKQILKLREPVALPAPRH